MLVGVPKEIKVLENRVGLVPGSVREAVAHGHEVIVEHSAGQGIGMDDDAYRKAGARVVGTAREVFDAAEMIVKVKEPQAGERKMLRRGQIQAMFSLVDQFVTPSFFAGGFKVSATITR